MVDFWRKLTELISQYTVADTASAFAIVEGIATVVAAVGAIIAVIVTKKIAKNQNKLFEEQNKISVAQVELTKQQNRIALYQKREEAYDYFMDFICTWRSFCESISMDFGIDEMQKCRSAIEYMSEKFLNRTISPAANGNDYNIVNFEMVSNDTKYLVRLRNLATNEPQINDYLMCLMRMRQTIATTMSDIIKRNQPTVSLEENAKAFLGLLNSAEANEIIIKLIDYLAMD